jgi:uncharacterized protein (TIGR00255 family)
MTRSMTGFGSGAADDGERVFTVEVRSVNHRFCEVRTILPSELSGLGTRLEALVRRHLSRGRVELAVTVKHRDDGALAPRLDLARARAFKAACVVLAEELGLRDDLTVTTVAALPGVVRGPEALDGDRAMSTLEPAVDRALRELVQMREREGVALVGEMRARLQSVRGLASEVRRALPRILEERKQRLEARLGALLGDRQLDPLRLAQEVAILADRSDVTEELERLDSHCAQLEGLFADAEPIGRKLDFLLQELHREVNTLGSKSSDPALAYLVVDLKAELERLREQAQNVE